MGHFSRLFSDNKNRQQLALSQPNITQTLGRYAPSGLPGGFLPPALQASGAFRV